MSYVNLRQYMNHRPLCYALIGGISLMTGCKSWNYEPKTEQERKMIDLMQEKSRQKRWEDWRMRE